MHNSLIGNQLDKINYLAREKQHLYSTTKKADIIDNSFIKEIFPQYSSQNINKIVHTFDKKWISR